MVIPERKAVSPAIQASLFRQLLVLAMLVYCVLLLVRPPH